MTIALSTCAVCKVPFNRLRTAQRTCSRACKKVLFRAEKRDAGHSAASEGQTKPSGPDTPPETDEMVRIWGPNRLSEIELRMMSLEPTGLRSTGGAMLYRRTA